MHAAPTTRRPSAHPARALALALCAGLLVVGGCASSGKKAKRDRAYVAQDVETLYSVARATLARNDYRTAAAMFDEVERQHPYSVWARRAQLMSAFSYYASRQYPQAVQSAQRFLSLHPGNKNAAYAYYIIAISYYEQIADVTHDQQITKQARSALEELVRRFPDTSYAADARLKLDLVNDHLAGKELEIGRFYARDRRWIAAAVRYQAVIDHYQTTSHTAEALYRLVEAYLALGIPEQAQRNAAVLGANFPGSPWYQRAYTLMRRYAPKDMGSAGPAGSGAQAAASAAGPRATPAG